MGGDRSKIGRSSRRKGAVGELAAAKVLDELTGRPGWERSGRQQRRGGGDGVPDLVHPTIRDLHCEVKVGAAPPVLAGLEQAIAEANDGAVPLVLAKRNDGSGRWVLAVEVELFWSLVESLGGRRG